MIILLLVALTFAEKPIPERTFPEERGILIVGERTYHASLYQYKDIAYFYHNELDANSIAFRKEFVANGPTVRKQFP